LGENKFYSSFTKTEEISAVIAREDVEVFTDTYKIPDYHTFDASFRHGFNIGAFETTVTLRVNNVFNNIYISEAFDSSGNNQPDLFGDEDNEPTVLIFPGAGRTWNLSAKIKF